MAAPPALREPGRERARQRVDRPLEREHLLARRVHEVDVLGQRLAQRARHRLDATVGDEPAPDLRLDQLAQLAQPRVELLAGEPLVELAVADVAPLAAASPISRAREVVEVELPQRPVQVVRAADGPARLHARERGRRPSPRAGAAASGPSFISASRSISASSSRRELAARRSPPAGASPSALVELADLAVALAVAVDARRVQREVDVEDGVERAAGGGGASPAWRRAPPRNASRSASVDVLDRRASRRGSRSSRPGSPAARSSCTNPWRTSSIDAAPTSATGSPLDCGSSRRQLRGVPRPHPRAAGSRVPTFGSAAPCAPWRCRTGTSAGRAASRR